MTRAECGPRPALRTTNVENGLQQVFTLPVPPALNGDAAPATVSLDLAVGDGLKPRNAAYYVDLVALNGEEPLRYGAIRATDAKGKALKAEISVARETEGTPAGVRVVVDLVGAASPIEVNATVRQPAQLSTAQAAEGSGEIAGIPQPLAPLVTETVDEIMDRERFAPPAMLALPAETHPEFEFEPQKQDNPVAPDVSSWPPSNELMARIIGPPSQPQSVGLVNFEGVGLSESGFIPPDSMGNVGSTQIIMHENGRIKGFDKTGVRPSGGE